MLHHYVRMSPDFQSNLHARSIDSERFNKTGDDYVYDQSLLFKFYEPQYIVPGLISKKWGLIPLIRGFDLLHSQ